LGLKYLIIIEPTTTGYSAYSPDLPGCVATGADAVEVRRNMREAIAMHLEAMREEGYDIPPPASVTDYVEVAVSLGLNHVA